MVSSVSATLRRPWRRPTFSPAPLPAAWGILADRVVGEPPAAWHPVRLFGTSMEHIERSTYRDARLAGVVHAAVGTGVGVAVGSAVGSTAAATCVAVAGRALWDEALRVGDALAASDHERARALLPGLVGRDVDDLDSHDMARAVVESVAENTVDAVVAPAWWAAVAGAPGALGYRAVNTLDAMVGHKDERYLRFGWASARLDDVTAFVPARLTAALVAMVRPRRAVEVWRVVRTQSPAHPSPNAGVAEGAWAAALGVRLGGVNRYGSRLEHRPALGFGRRPEPGDILRAVELSRRVTDALVGLLVAIGLGRASLRPRRRAS